MLDSVGSGTMPSWWSG